MSANIGLMDKLRFRLKMLEHRFLQYRQSTGETALATTEYGKVKGAKRMAVYGEAYYSFEGIPYAQPPLGELRFRAPQRPTPWVGIRDCGHNKDKATQMHFILNRVEGSEDCLYLNVYTNNLNPEMARPVMVWIHGGGFFMGEATRDLYGPDYFMRTDVVLVTVQYRLGLFGFLRLDAPSLGVPGNAGLKDQVMALKWVKNNCANFGGNPDCITLFGESAGAASAHYLMLCEQTRGLFHRAILMSGNAFCKWAYMERQGRALAIAKLAGYKGDDSDKDVLAFLLNAKARDLMRVQEQVLTAADLKQRTLVAFAPTIEPYEMADCVIPRHPREMMKTAWSNTIPVITGCTSFEGLLQLLEVKLRPSILKELASCINFLPPELTDPEYTSDDNIDGARKLKQAHVAGEIPTADEYLDIHSYMLFVFPMHRLILSRFAHAASAPLYLYRFDFDSENLINPFRMYRGGRGVKGVSHADDITYLFWNCMASRLDAKSREYRTIDRMVGLWAKFADTGNPNDALIDGLDAITWEPLNKSDDVYKCLNIGDDLSFIDLPEMAKVRVWESLYDAKRELLY